MAQVLSTFSRLEQSRFEAFRRATFPRDAIAKYVAHCLIEEQHRPVSQGDPIAAATESRQQQTQPRTKPLREPILKQVVAPGQAEDITIVVSTLAKAYAQRLVTAARRQANIRSTAEAAAASNDSNSQFSTPDKTSPRKAAASTQATAAITPEDIIKALQERKAQGLDPGFFLQPWEQSQSVLVDNDVYQQKRLAALKAQDDWDEKHGGPPPADDEEGDGKPKANENNDDATKNDENGDDKKEEAVPMDISSPSGTSS
ncbi:MAG: hypothetical protein SGARI_006128 [Bacillariaceae sp.]